jgi:hypothetical protein
MSENVSATKVTKKYFYTTIFYSLLTKQFSLRMPDIVLSSRKILNASTIGCAGIMK